MPYLFFLGTVTDQRGMNTVLCDSQFTKMCN